MDRNGVNPVWFPRLSVDCNTIPNHSLDREIRGRQMASITIRNIDDGTERRLRVRAAEHGRSMEEESREILREIVGDLRPSQNLGWMCRRPPLSRELSPVLDLK